MRYCVSNYESVEVMVVILLHTVYTVCSQLLFNSLMTQNMLSGRALVSLPHLCLLPTSANLFTDLISCCICLSDDFHFK